MSPLDQELTDSLPEMFTTMGSEVFVKGRKINAIYEERQEPTESGYINVSTISIAKADTDYFERGNSVYVDTILYKIKNITNDDEVLTLVELYRA